jgi:hypothetical protein
MARRHGGLLAQPLAHRHLAAARVHLKPARSILLRAKLGRAGESLERIKLPSGRFGEEFRRERHRFDRSNLWAFRALSETPVKRLDTRIHPVESLVLGYENIDAIGVTAPGWC